MKKILKKAKGFTLIELIVVIAILAILAAILIPSITNYITTANNSKNQANARSEYSRVVLSWTTTNGAPVTAAAATITSGTAYTLDSALSCTLNFTTTSITGFSCSSSTKTYSLANNFSPS